MAFFFNKDDKISVLKRDLKTAIQSGDIVLLKDTLEGMDADMPRRHLLPALKIAIDNDQVETTRLLLKHKAPLHSEPDALRGIIRNVVYKQHFDMFELLNEHGLDFASYKPSENGRQYYFQMHILIRDLDCKRLRQEIESLKHEITELRKTAPPPPEPGKPGIFIIKSP